MRNNEKYVPNHLIRILYNFYFIFRCRYLIIMKERTYLSIIIWFAGGWCLLILFTVVYHIDLDNYEKFHHINLSITPYIIWNLIVLKKLKLKTQAWQHFIVDLVLKMNAQFSYQSVSQCKVCNCTFSFLFRGRTFVTMYFELRYEWNSKTLD